MAATYQNQTDRQKLIVTSISAIISGGISRLICHPIDTIKSNLQVETSRKTSKNLISNMIWKTATGIYKKDGIKGLYQGYGVNTLGSAPALALFYTSYEFAKMMFARNNVLDGNENTKNFLCGIFAETVSCVLWVPVDVIKERLQVQSSLKSFYYKNTFDAVRKIWKIEGPVGFYRAYGATLLAFGPFSALYLTVYEGLKRYFIPSDQEIGFYESTLLGGVGGTVASIATNPLDVVKLRMQVQDHRQIAGSFKYRNIFHGVYSIISNEGFLALFKGSLARSLYHTPNIAISLGLLEYSRNSVTKFMY